MRQMTQKREGKTHALLLLLVRAQENQDEKRQQLEYILKNG